MAATGSAETSKVLEQQHPSWGWIREIGMLSHLSLTPGVRKGHGPVLGQDTRELLTELGYGADRIDELVAAGVCVAAGPRTGSPDRCTPCSRGSASSTSHRLIHAGYVTQLLADLGADVIKVERPGTGDYLRTLPR